MTYAIGPFMDEEGDFFALVGVHRKLELLREWIYHTGMTLFDICDGREVWPNIRVAQAVIVDSEDESTWPDHVREAVEDGGWCYEWDQFMELDPEGPITVTVYGSD